MELESPAEGITEVLELFLENRKKLCIIPLVDYNFELKSNKF